jgi:hypothetical protein
MPRLNLQGLDDHFSEEEVWNVIRALPPPLDKALDPDGFTAYFLQVVWHVIRPDVMLALDVIG